jgi:hypothetical protein
MMMVNERSPGGHLQSTRRASGRAGKKVILGQQPQSLQKDVRKLPSFVRTRMHARCSLLQEDNRGRLIHYLS